MAKTYALLPRISITWLLIAQLLVIAPLVIYLPFWATILWLFCAGWRIQIYRSKLKYPNAGLKILLMVGSAAAIYFSRGSLIGVDAGVALLICAFTLKLIELRTYRDALVLIFLGFFCILTSYLFDSGLLSALYSLVPFSALLAALIGLQQTRTAAKPAHTWRIAWSLMLQAVPLMLVLFLLFPRVGPLWSLPAPSDQAKTGLSDRMTPGDVANLSQSADLVFRASFTGEIPARDKLYWRALTFNYFDGQTWSSSPEPNDMRAPEWKSQDKALDYQVIMQPSNRTWLYALDTATSSDEYISQRQDFRLQRGVPVTQLLGYKVRSWPHALRQTSLSHRQQRYNLQLPSTSNPRARQFAQKLQAQTKNTDELVQTLLRHFNQQPYYYTLTPPTLGDDSVDQFMFDTRSGFCAHYAGATVFILRSAGIPARMVVGYQGGEYNQEANFVQVRQFDAHAWVEYWQEGSGWQVIDPTFQVAPDRIELGLEAALAGQDGYLANSPFSPLNYSNIAWINSMRILWDQVNFQWQSKILNFQRDQQEDWFANLFGQWSWQQILLTLVFAVLFLLAAIGLLLLKPWQRKYTPLQQAQRKLDKFLAKQKLARFNYEGLHAYTQRVTAQLTQNQQQALAEYIPVWDSALYQQSNSQLAPLKAALKQLKAKWRS